MQLSPSKISRRNSPLLCTKSKFPDSLGIIVVKDLPHQREQPCIYGIQDISFSGKSLRLLLPFFCS